MAYLSYIELQNKGDKSGLLNSPIYRTKPVFGAFAWMDQNKRYFIFNEGSMEKCRPYTRM